MVHCTCHDNDPGDGQSQSTTETYITAEGSAVGETETELQRFYRHKRQYSVFRACIPATVLLSY